MTDDDEPALLRRAAAGDPRAVAALYAAHVDALYAFAFYRTDRDAGLAEDIVHDTLLDGLRHASDFDPARVAIARALANEPSLILADEPTAALDSVRSRTVMELFRKVAHERGAAVLVVTHDHRALDVFDHLYEMEDGRLRPYHPAAATAAAPVFLVRVCLIPVNLPVHWRVHNLPLIPFGFSPDA